MRETRLKQPTAVPMIVLTRHQDQVEAINKALRNAGHPVHLTWLPDARELGDALTQIAPEMIIYFADEDVAGGDAVLDLRARFAPEVPVVVVRERLDEATITELVDYDEFCGSPTEATVDGQIGVDELARWLDDRRRGIRDFVLVDVREDDERARATIAGSVGVPVGGFLDGSALAAVPADRQIVLFCEVGARSAQALAVVRAAGRADAVHVAGGMAAWSAQCEQPAQPARREPSARPPVAPASD